MSKPRGRQDKCSVCGIPGHKAPNCPKKSGVSAETSSVTSQRTKKAPRYGNVPADSRGPFRRWVRLTPDGQWIPFSRTWCSDCDRTHLKKYGCPGLAKVPEIPASERSRDSKDWRAVYGEALEGKKEWKDLDLFLGTQWKKIREAQQRRGDGELFALTLRQHFRRHEEKLKQKEHSEAELLQQLVVICGSNELSGWDWAAVLIEGMDEALSRKRNSSHWWCGFFSDLYDALDSASVFGGAIESVIAKMDDGADRDWMEKTGGQIVSKVVGKAAGGVFDAASGIAGARLVVAALAALFCPDPDKCPAGGSAAWKALGEIYGAATAK